MKKEKAEPLRILLVEDNQSDRIAFSQAFKKVKISIETVECASAEDALVTFHKDPSSFDVVVSAHSLPNKSGLDMFKELLKEGVELPLLILTKTDEEDIAAKALKAGVDNYIIKDPDMRYLKLLPWVLTGAVIGYDDRRARKSAEDTLKESEESYRTITENLPGIAYRVFLKEKGRMHFFNDMIVLMTGYQVDELKLGEVCQLDPFIFPEDLENVVKIVGDSIKENKSFEVEYRFKHKDGKIRNFLERGKPIYDLDGSPLYVDGIILDITENKQVEEAMREEKERAQKYLDIAEIILIALNDKGEITLLNRKGNSILGYEEGELIGKNWFDTCLHEDVRDEVSAAFKKLIEGELELVEYYENTILTKTGEERIIAWHNSIYKNKEGNIVGILSSGEDITERKRAEEELWKSEKKYREVVENISDMIYVFDDKGNLKFFNKSIEEHFGYSKEDLQNRSFKDLVTPKSVKYIEKKFRMQLADEDTGTFELEFVNKKGELRFIEARERLVWEGDRIVEIHGIGRDVTDRKAAEEKIIHQNCVLRSIRDVNQLIVREKDKNILLKESCRILNEVKGYHMVWIGFVEEGHKRVVPMAYAGFNEGYLDSIKITWDDTKTGNGPTGTAIKTKKMCVCNDAANSDKFLPWTKEAEKRGYRSWIAVPIIHGGKIFGALNVYSDAVNTFVGEEIDLLEEISGDIALALYTIELEHLRDKAEKALQESEELYKNLFDTALVGLWRASIKEGKFIRSNLKSAEMVGVNSVDELLKKHKSSEFYPPDKRDELLRLLKENGEVSDFEGCLTLKDGTEKDISISAKIFPEKDYIEGVIIDITDRKRAEKALKESEELYRNLFDTALVGLWRTALEDGSYLRSNLKNAEIVGVSSVEELLTKHKASEFYPPDKRDELLGLLKESGEVSNHELHLTLKDGTEKDVSISAKVYPDEGHLEGVIIDITDRKKSEEALRESEERYRLLADNMVEYIFVSDMELNIAFTTESSINTVGYTPDEMVGHKTWEFYSDEENKKIIEIISEEIVKDPPHQGRTLELTLIHKNGHEVPVEINAKILYDEDGKPTGIQGTVRDITERKAAEEALKTSEEKYRTVLENIEDGYFEVDIVGNYTFFNDSMCKILGYSKSEMLGMNNKFYMDKKTAKDVYEVFNEIFRTKKAMKVFDWELIRKDKSRAIVSTSITPIIDTSKNVVGFRGIARDITERMQAEEALRDSEEQFRLLFDNMIDGFAYHEIVLNDEGQPTDYIFLEINDAFEEMTGLKRKDVIGKKVTEALPGIEKDEFDWIGVYGKVALTGEGISFNQHSEALGKWFSITAYSPIKGFFAVLFEDITEKRKLEEQLLRSQKMEAIGTLAGGIAHDFNNILATILGYSSFLKSKVKKGDSIYDGFAAIESSAIRASELTSQLLAYSRKGKLEVKPVNINRVVKEVHNFISKTFDKSIKVKLKTEKGLSTVEGDDSQLNQVVMNLAVNAQNAMPDGGLFKITTYSEVIKDEFEMLYFSIVPGNYVCIKFTDTGIGMDNETLKRIFEPYFTTRGDKGGTGLGMSVVFGIVKGHDGFIDINSLPGKGTEITIYFPASDREEDLFTKEIGETRKGTETLLLIDDEEDILVLLDGVLTDFGYTVHTSISGKDGLDIFVQNKGKIDLVILDIKMPDMSGKDVLVELLKIDPETKVLLTSGYSEEDQHHDLLKMGATDFIGKPFITDKLLKKIRDILD